MMMDELRELLINVPDSYDDFVDGLLDEARKSETKMQGLLGFLKANPNVTTSEVVRFLVDDLGLYEEYRSKQQNLYFANA